MVGVIIWALAVIAIFLLLKGYYDYKYFIACYDGLIFLGKRIGKFLVGRGEWFKELRFLKQAYIVVAGFTAIALFILFFRLYLEIILFNWGKTANIDSSIRNLALAFLGTVSGIGALFGVYLAILRSEENTRQNKIANKQSEIAQQQANTAEEGLITDRINKAVESLGKNHENGKPLLEIRIGAIYALERIAKDSERDHVPIMELLCAYIRTNSSNDDKEIITNPIREDIREALTIIGLRNTWSEYKSRIEIERTQRMRLNFYNCYLKHAELYGANLSGANLYKTNLENSWLNGADLSRARLMDLNINTANLIGVKTSGAHAWSGDFSGCHTLNQKQLDVMFLGKVDLPLGLTHPQKYSKYDKNYNSYSDFMDAYREWLRETGY